MKNIGYYIRKKGPYGARTRWATVWLLSVLCFAAVALGQTAQTGAIRGTVQDPTKGVMANATVSATNAQTNLSIPAVTTGPDGVFTLSQLPPGTYSVQVSAPGFKTATLTTVVVRVTEVTPVTVNLEVGDVATKVEVAADLFNPVQTENATTGVSIDSREILGATLSKRNYLDLLSLSAGTNGVLGGADQLGKGNPVVNVNGQRAGQNNYTIDGINANDFNLPILTNVPVPTPDSIAEFKVQTSMYDATYGRNGGGQINAVMKSGTKDFHGSAFEYYRDTSLNANDWFLNRAGRARPILHLNTYGGSAGGPIPIMKDFFFFAAFQGTREKNGQAPGGRISTSLPATLTDDRSEAALRNTFFTPAQLSLLDRSGIRLDPVAVRILQLRSNLYGPNGFLIPTPGPGGVFTISSPDTYKEDQFTANLDKQITSQNRFSIRGFLANSKQSLPFGSNVVSGLGFQENLPINNRIIALTDQHTFSPTVVNEGRFGFTRIVFVRTPSPPITAGQVGSTSPAGPAAPIWNFTFAGVSVGANSNSDRGTVDNTFTFTDTFSWIRGRHSMRFGGDFARYQLNRYNRFGQFGTVGFSGSIPLRDPAGNIVTDGGSQVRLSATQYFLIGQPSTSTINIGDPTGQFRVADFSFFFQDDFKVVPRLTLNLGLRWDGFATSHDKRGKLINFDYDTGQFLVPSDINTNLFPGATGTPGVGSTTLLNERDRKNWAPRVGFAYDVFGNGKTAVRGGFGIFYQRASNQPLLQISLSSPFRQQYAASPTDPTRQLTSNILGNPFPNFARSTNLTTPRIPVVTGFTCDPNGPNGSACLTMSGPLSLNPAIDRNFRAPYTYQYNLTIQQQLPWHLLAEIGYVGTQGRRLVHVDPDPDTPVVVSPSNPFYVTDTSGNRVAITTNTATNARARTRYPGFTHDGNSYFVTNTGMSYYNSGQFTLLRRFSNMYFQAAYTFSKSMDTSSGNERDPVGPSELDQGATNDPRNLRLSRGLSDYDRTHIFRLSMDYTFPLFGGSGPLRWVLNGWGINALVTYESGLPLYIVDGDACGITPAATCTPSFAPGFGPNNIRAGGDPRTHTVATKPYVRADAFVTPIAPNSPSGDTGYGLVGRNIARGPFQQNWDFSIRKRTALFGEARNLEIAFNFFNLFNHPVFDTPSNATGITPFANDLSVPGFGVITRTVTNPRIIQLVARFNF